MIPLDDVGGFCWLFWDDDLVGVSALGGLICEHYDVQRQNED